VAKGEKKVARKQRKPNAVRRYFNETVGELRKVSWPTRKEAINLTIVVVIVVISMSIFLGSLDFIFGKFFELLLF
jgi:preprotein translocase subunit SecE